MVGLFVSTVPRGVEERVGEARGPEVVRPAEMHEGAVGPNLHEIKTSLYEDGNQQ